MQVIPIKTRIVAPPQDNIYDILDKAAETLQEKDILLITSKIIAIHQGLCIPVSKVKDKDELIKKEAEVFIPREECPGEHVILTVKDYTLIPSAGIDESNADGYYILWPKDSYKEAKKICEYLKQKAQIKDLAVIITDSKTIPMRYGTIGISTGFYGMEPFKNYIGTEDIFGRELKMTRSNIVDALAVVGVLAMGEGNEQTPLAIIRDYEGVKFTDKETYSDLIINAKEDIYYPLLKKFYEK